MLKLLKFELIHSYRQFGFIFALYIASCVLLPFASAKLELLHVFITLLFTGLLFAAAWSIYSNFYQSMFKSGGYLTLTLPFSSHEILISKIIGSFFWLTISSLILFLGLGIYGIIFSYISSDYFPTYYEIKEIFSALSSLIDEFKSSVGISSGFELLFYYIISQCTAILSIFALCTAVQTKYTRKRKKLAAFVIVFVYSFVMSLIEVFLSSNFSVSAGRFSLSANSNLSFYPSLIITVIQCIVYYFFTIYILDHQLELE